MTREEAITNLNMISVAFVEPVTKEQRKLIDDTFEMAIQALSQEPCELLIIKSDILLHQDDRKKWVESIKREKESGVIILPPYFEPLLVPNDIEINIEQEPCDDVVSRILTRMWNCRGKHTTSIDKVKMEQIIRDELPSVTQKSKTGHWSTYENYQGGIKETWYECSECKWSSALLIPRKYCPNCGTDMKG